MCFFSSVKKTHKNKTQYISFSGVLFNIIVNKIQNVRVPGAFRFPVDTTVSKLKTKIQKGIPSLMLFGMFFTKSFQTLEENKRIGGAVDGDSD